MNENLSYEHIQNLNRPIFALDDSHPAKRFLESFVDCRFTCAGRELELAGQKPVEQQWTSAVDGRRWTFSGFIYYFVCFGIELDGFLQELPFLTESEAAAARNVPVMRLMMNECSEAARKSGNSEIVELTKQVLQMIRLWEEYLDFRREMIARA